MKNNIELQKQFIEADNEAMLQTQIVAAFIGLSVSWLNNKAVSGGGIQYTKFGNRRLYKKQDVLNWFEKHSQKVNSTSEYQKGENYGK